MPPGRPGRTEAVNGDVRIGGSPHRPPEKLAHESGVALPGGPLDYPSEEIGVGGDVVEGAAVRAVRLGEAPESEPVRATRRTALAVSDSTPTGGTVHPTRVGFSHKHVNQLVKGKVPLTEETALRLAMALGTSAGFWLTREARYRERLVRLESASRRARGHPGSMSRRSCN